MKRSIQLGAIIVAFSPVPAVAATLLGASASVEYRVPTLMDPYPQTTYAPQTFTIGAGLESAVTIENVTSFNIDFTDLSLNIDFDTVLSNPTLNSTSFNGLVFSSAAFNQISGITLNASTNLAGFDSSRVSVAGDELRINLSGLSYDSATVVGLDFSANAAVPEPASWAMMVGGFGLLGAAARRCRPRARLSSACS